MTTETRTAEQVGMELAEVRWRLRVLERLNETTSRLDHDASFFLTQSRQALEALEGMGISPLVGQVMENIVAMRDLVGDFQPEFCEQYRLLHPGLPRSLIPRLKNREHALKQELAALEPPKAETVGLFERVIQAAQNALSFGHPA